jgi:hypothetical protein
VRFVCRLEYPEQQYGVGAVPKTRQYTTVVEVPKNLVHRRRSGSIRLNLSEKAVALNPARQAALAALSTGPEPVVWPCDEDALWYEDRPYVIDENTHDHEESGARVWKIAVAPVGEFVAGEVSW